MGPVSAGPFFPRTRHSHLFLLCSAPPSERSAIAQARGAVSKGAVGAIAFRRSGDPNIGEYGEAVLICKEGDLPDSVMEMLAA